MQPCLGIQVVIFLYAFLCFLLTHWCRVRHICVGKLTIIGSDNGLSPERRQAIIWTNAGILLIGPLGTNFSEILIEIQTFSLKKIRLKMSSAKCCSFRACKLSRFRVTSLLCQISQTNPENKRTHSSILMNTSNYPLSKNTKFLFCGNKC